MPSLRDWLDLRLGGAYDNTALLAAIGGGMFANPEFAGLVEPRLLGAAVSAAGAAMLTAKFKRVMRPRAYESGIKIHSDKTPEVNLDRDWGGMLLGYTVDTAEPVVIPWDDWMRHAFIVGQSGMGKTVLGEWLMFQQIVYGGGLIWIDGKIDADNIEKLHAMCAWAGRRHQLKVINPGNPNASNTYNPILYGSPDEVSSRVLSLIPSSENNPGTDYFRQAANEGITTLVGGIKGSTSPAYNFLDLSILLQNERALEHLMTLMKDGSARDALALFYERFKSPDRNGVMRIDLKKLRDTFGGVGGRMHMFGTGEFGRITGTYDPDVVMYDALVNQDIVYIALPTMGKPEAASNFGKMTVGDYRSAIAEVQNLTKSLRPWPPTLGFFDEAGSYVTQAWARIFEQSRSAHQVLVPAIQTIANLDAVSKELREMVVGNTVTKVSFRIGTDETAEKFADLFGTESVSALSVSLSGGGGENAQAGTGTKQSQSRSASVGYGEREEEVHRISINDLKGLEQGEAIVYTGGKRVYHVKIPRLTFDDEFMKQIGKFEVNRRRRKFVTGLDLGRDVERWIS